MVLWLRASWNKGRNGADDDAGRRRRVHAATVVVVVHESSSNIGTHKHRPHTSQAGVVVAIQRAHIR